MNQMKKFSLLILFSSFPFYLSYGQIKTKVVVIIEKLPIEKQEKMREFDKVIKEYVETADWFEEDDRRPIEITLQLYLTDYRSNFEDRYRCEFLIASSDVQYFDKRVRFPYQTGDQLVYNNQAIDPFTGVINFYVNLILANELDKFRSYGGDFYYKRAQTTAALGKFVRTEFIRGWTERDELIKRVFNEPFKTFRRMKDYYFYGLYVIKENIGEARNNMRTALNLLEEVIENEIQLDEAKQFLDYHHQELIKIFKDAKDSNTIMKKLIDLDPKHSELYEEHITDS